MILNQFRLQILPEIRHKIKWLDLESSSMRYVSRGAHYLNLCGLGLYNVNEVSARCLFTGKTISFNHFYSKQKHFFLTNTVHMYLDEILSSEIIKNQITILLITMDKNDDYDEMLLSVGNM
ncbi:unnamed protein product [Rotaria sp. Silwood2]|nr:unnamed protein product [Rotaria sp. Silwood2]CAF2794531.1 unnamed protein product [Rotaria sp. Silwood2]CAF3028913.1 unnamed protein product [Rotaria sp. Silwood2]CAF3357581.1 unnamed protein product [Rotaria sp. Silwood2]CAF4066631.1 unnamed protein product [Rotaria sp. Silwood2]